MGAYTDETPKSLLPVGDRPIIDYLLDDLRRWKALTSIHVAVNDRDHDAFRSWASERKPVLDADGIDIQLHNDGVSDPNAQLGAVGDLHFLLEETGLPPDGALVSGGDSLYRFPLAPILNAFDGQTSQVLALHEPNETLRRQSSTLVLTDGQVNGLSDEPSEVGSKRICPSWYLLSPSSLKSVGRYLQDGKDPDTLGTLIDDLAQTQQIQAIVLPERPHLRLHCNTPDDLNEARTVLRSDQQFLLDETEIRRRLPTSARKGRGTNRGTN